MWGHHREPRVPISVLVDVARGLLPVVTVLALIGRQC